MELIKYDSSAEMERLMEEKAAQGLVLVAVQDHLDGKHLVFDAPPDGEGKTDAERIKKLEERITSLEGIISELKRS
jgi:hypothetical protein